MNLRQAFLALYTKAAGVQASFEAQLETWFNDLMDRLSGEYTRLSQYTMLAIGLVLAISLNASTFDVATRLWTDSYTRDALVGRAAAYSPPPPSSSPPNGVSNALQDVEAADQKLVGLTLPIGWPDAATLARRTLREWSITVLGWVVTALAVSLGARFWFDNLQKLMKFRNAGPKNS